MFVWTQPEFPRPAEAPEIECVLMHLESAEVIVNVEEHRVCWLSCGCWSSSWGLVLKGVPWQWHLLFWISLSESGHLFISLLELIVTKGNKGPYWCLSYGSHCWVLERIWYWWQGMVRLRLVISSTNIHWFTILQGVNFYGRQCFQQWHAHWWAVQLDSHLWRPGVSHTLLCPYPQPCCC